MALIFDRDGSIVFENGDGIGEINSMLLEVEACFFRVPLIGHQVLLCTLVHFNMWQGVLGVGRFASGLRYTQVFERPALRFRSPTFFKSRTSSRHPWASLHPSF
jgi:hypothetical protein